MEISPYAPLSYGAKHREQRKPLRAHWAHMIVHGVLHLLGYDHEDEHDAQRMEALEVRILARMGIDNPYVVALAA